MNMYLQKIAIGVVAATLIAGPTVALGQSAGEKKPLGKMTCEDFLALDETVQPNLVYFAAAYAKGGEPEAAMLDVEGTEKITPILIEDCKTEPKESFWKKVKAEFAKIEKKM